MCLGNLQHSLRRKMVKKKPDKKSGLKMRTHIKLYIQRGSNSISSIF